MFIVNGSNSKGIVTAEHSTLEEALAKASEFMTSGMGHVSILDLDRKTYTEKEIELLFEIEKLEHKVLSKP